VTGEGRVVEGPEERVAPEPGARLAQVVVGLPVPRVFSYSVPASLVPQLAAGHRVRVPFHGRVRAGVVIAVVDGEAAGLEPVDALLDPVPALTEPLLALARWAATETASAWGEAVARALPPSARPLGPGSLPPDPPASAPGPLVVGYGGGRARLVEAAVRRALDDGQGALVLAPEIETATAWAADLTRLVGEPVPCLTSDASPRRRWEIWWAFRQGAGRLAVGTRVAAFLPVRGLGLTVVLDEHDPTHKALDVPRWHTRELAIGRARIEGGTCLLTSATPSLESWARVQAGQATAEEAKTDRWPVVHRVDLRTRAGAGCLSPDLREAVREALAAGQSVLLLLNRLGYGRSLGCGDCGAVPRCPRCRVAFTYHLGARVLACRLCGGRESAPRQCERCRGRRLQALGWGTERLAAEAQAKFPGAGVARYDGELSAERAAAAREAFRAGAARVLVGTHMALRLCAEAPVGLAALVLADESLHRPDFRAAERTFQLAWHLAEAVAPAGSLWLQSYYPTHPALEAVALGARERFYEPEWAERRELGYPPARRMARIVTQGGDAVRLATDLAGRAQAAGLSAVGPVRMAGGRFQLLLQGGDELPAAVTAALAPLRGRRRVGPVRLTVDIDPVEL
jgi:primosomal protein N' (replication factor Y) (superfamily II helicase)